MLALAIFVFAALAVFLVLWIAVPFAVFGIKDLLRESIEEQKKTNRLLESATGRARKPRQAGAAGQAGGQAGGEQAPSSGGDRQGRGEGGRTGPGRGEGHEL